MRTIHTTHTSLCLPTFLLAFAAMALVTTQAQASLSLELSVGSDIQINKPTQYQATNILITPGVEILQVLHVELGVLGMLNAQRNGLSEQLGLEIRPMLRLTLPLLPIYGRVILALVEPFSQAHRTVAYGPVVGVGFSLFGLGIFAEAGLLPRYINQTWNWITEGRLGVEITAF